jgi:hypothetical protein
VTSRCCFGVRAVCGAEFSRASTSAWWLREELCDSDKLVSNDFPGKATERQAVDSPQLHVGRDVPEQTRGIHSVRVVPQQLLLTELHQWRRYLHEVWLHRGTQVV